MVLKKMVGVIVNKIIGSCVKGCVVSVY